MPLAKIGAFAEYAAVDESALAIVPEYLSMEEAACVPLTALTAMQALSLMDAQTGQTIFISGGTGSLGAMAIPIAARMGLAVATNGSASNKERVLKLGATTFIDYRTQRYTDVLHDVDCVLDTLDERELEDEFSALKLGGHLVSLRGLPNGRFARRANLSPASVPSSVSQATGSTGWQPRGARPTISCSCMRTDVSSSAWVSSSPRSSRLLSP